MRSIPGLLLKMLMTMRLKPDRFNYLVDDSGFPEPQRSLVKVGDSFVRVHRIGAPAPGLNRIDTDDPGDDRVTFVLIHGIGLSATYLLPLADELCKYGEVLMVDLPGFGDLPAPPRAMTLCDFADVLCSVLDLNGISDPILVGHSMGAQIAVEMMASYPSRFRRAALIGPPVNIDERTPGWVVARYSQSSIWERPSLVRVALWSYVRAAAVWMAQIMPRVLDYPIEERIAEVSPDAKFVFIRGEHDHLVPPVWLDFLAQRVPEAEIFTVPGAAHSTLYNDDRNVSTHVVTLLEECER